MSENQWYRGDDGRTYLARRGAAIQSHVQRLRASMFEGISRDCDSVLDFGSGTGEILSYLPAAERIGIEIGEEVAELARLRGIIVRKDLCEVESKSVDVVISFHALEHVHNPLEILISLRRVLRPNGRLRIVVPCELPFRRMHRSWKPNNDRHFFTWTPLLIGNLAMRAGFENIETRLVPMPSGSRFSRLVRGPGTMARALRFGHALWYCRLNTVLEVRS